jgi:hypothetical protein
MSQIGSPKRFMAMTTVAPAASRPAFAYAGGVVAQKPVLRHVSPLMVTWLACTIGAVSCRPGWAFLSEVPPLLVLPGGALCLAGVAVARTRGRRAR